MIEKSQEKGLVWIDGIFNQWDNAKVHAMSQTLHYGFGVYEGVRSYSTANGVAIFRLEDHTKRLFNSAKILDLEVPYSADFLNQIQQEVLAKSGLTNAYIRPMVFLAEDFLGLHSQISKPHMLVGVFPWKQSYLTNNQFSQGIKAKTSSFTRMNPRNGLCNVKANGLYLMAMLANNEAKKSGFDDAIMLDNEGYVAESSAANIFLVKDQALHTPELTSALDGITRRTVIALAHSQQIPVHVRKITRDELFCAEEVFICGTASEILAITNIDERKIGNSTAGNITIWLKEQYQALVTGKLNNYQHWLTEISTNKLLGETA